jgi:AraC family transcriptional regulator
MSNGDPAQGLGANRPIYIERVNAVIDYIEIHLTDDLDLATLADVAHFSPYHFHRIFTTMVGETLSRFIARVRVERAATLLIQHPDRSVTDIAVACGFTNPSSFARAFKEAFGMSASAWRAHGFASYEREPGETIRDVIGSVGHVNETYGLLDTALDSDTGAVTWTVGAGSLGETSVTIEHVPAMRVAYVRHTGRYQGLGEVFADLFTRLMTWAQPRGLVNAQASLLSVYHDNPSITEDDRLRVSVCITVPEGTEVSGGIGQMDVEGGTFAVGHFELGEHGYPEAWYAIAGGWLPDSGYEPDDRLPFERYPIGRTADHPGKHVVEIWLPVRPLRRY